MHYICDCVCVCLCACVALGAFACQQRRGQPLWAAGVALGRLRPHTSLCVSLLRSFMCVLLFGCFCPLGLCVALGFRVCVLMGCLLVGGWLRFWAWL